MRTGEKHEVAYMEGDGMDLEAKGIDAGVLCDGI